MVDFKQLLDESESSTTIDPVEIFFSLDKDSDKANLWAAQEAVLREWHTKYRNEKDTIVKLHTGQGKTLIGLLMLQSCLNEGKGPALYLCPNDQYLVRQTIQQAESFGIKVVESQPHTTALPREFLNSEAIFVTTCSKLFNGKSVFGVDGSNREPVFVDSIVLDDAHRCLDTIRDTFSVKVRANDDDNEKNPLYDEIFNLFKAALEKQAPGTYADISQGHDECILAVPYWSWTEKTTDLLLILQKNKESKELVFTWNLIKNHLEYCSCIISGQRIEIVPRLIPISLIPSFAEAKTRIFLSATLNEDAFLIKDLDINPTRIANPLSYSGIKYSGERLILIPSVVNPTLYRYKLIEWITSFAEKSRPFGIFVIVPSYTHASGWEEEGAIIPKNLDTWKEQLQEQIVEGSPKNVAILVNKYDGVDLPGNLCRVLILDSLPSYNTLTDRYHEYVRSGTGTIRRLQAQRIEQGMGRGIRGSNDHCVVVVIGTDVSEFLSENSKKQFLSVEAQTQIKIGEEIAKRLKSEGESLAVMEILINQCIQRDDGWRRYYTQIMSRIEPKPININFINHFVKERTAEICFQKNQPDKAISIINQLIEDVKTSSKDLGWYLQLKALYQYPSDPTTAMDIQIKAFESNSKVFRPPSGVRYSKLAHVRTTQAQKINDFLHSKETATAVILHIENIIEKLDFNLPSDIFEEGIDELGTVLGFLTQRPDKTYGEGPDNLWQVGEHQYWIIECKNEVINDRGISRSEANQMSGSISWFKANYEDSNYLPIIIHPSNYFMSGASIIDPSSVIQPDSLENIKRNLKTLYNSLSGMHSESISTELIKQKVREVHLDIEEMKTHVFRRITSTP